MKVVILAGGTGTRFWPVSREEKPKQFCAITSNEPMLSCTYKRFKKVFKKSDIFIATSDRFVPQIKKILGDKIAPKNYIIEPQKRDTAPAMGFAAALLSIRYPHEPIVFAPSDHYFEDEDKFLKSLPIADALIKKTGKMLDLGAVPAFPSTVLGYTRIGKLYKKENGVEVYYFKGHVEKPEYNKARLYLKRGDYLWHVSYYIWTPDKFLAAFKKYQPKMYLVLESIKNLLKSKSVDQRKIALEYKKLEKVSFDYAITEKMNPRDVLIIKGDFGWSDIGAWDVLYRKLSKNLDKNNNLVQANWHGIDTNDALIYGYDKKLIVTIGLSDLIVVDTPDALLICPFGRSQDVKKVVEQLRNNKKGKFL